VAEDRPGNVDQDAGDLHRGKPVLTQGGQHVSVDLQGVPVQCEQGNNCTTARLSDLPLK